MSLQKVWNVVRKVWNQKVWNVVSVAIIVALVNLAVGEYVAFRLECQHSNALHGSICELIGMCCHR